MHAQKRRYPPAMVACIYKLLPILIVALCLTTSVQADETQDLLVEKGVAAYDDGDYQRAKNILLPLAEAGHPKAMNKIGIMHYDGIVFPKDPNIECDWYKQAAQGNYASAMYNISICYNHGHGRTQDSQKMLFWRINAAKHGSTAAMINLAALDLTEGEQYRHWMMMAQEYGSAWAKVDLWLQGYKDDSQMNLGDFICVSWKITIMGGEFEDCD
ncbi:MAG: sel1 repeat family protein [Magnetovibrio sp.]|nr:sel1 repeat family protein [Magnetovibrio sp.]